MPSAREHRKCGIALCGDPSAGSPGVINKLNRLLSDCSGNLLHGVIWAKNHPVSGKIHQQWICQVLHPQLEGSEAPGLLKPQDLPLHGVVPILE